MRNFSRLFFITILAISFPATAWEIEESFTVDPGGQLTLRTERGAIEVETHSADSIQVLIEVDGYDEDEVNVDFTQQGNDLKIDADVKRRGWGHRRVQFFVTVPRSYNTDLSTAGGSIQVKNLQGKIDADTSGGSLEFYDITGDIDGDTSGGTIDLKRIVGRVNVQTSGGSIDVEDVSGNVYADTSGGSIHIENVKGDLEAETSGGSIRIADVLGGIEASTSGGSIRAALSEQPTGDVEMSTSGGGITVELAEDIGMTLRARASRVKSAFPVNGVQSAKKRLNGDINGGGPELDLHTSGGSIRIVQR